MPFPDSEVLTSIVSRIFRVDDITLGDPKVYVVRYHGQLLTEDSAAAYDQLAEAVRPYTLTPLFRIEDGRQTVYLVPSAALPRMGKISTNILLFVLTVLSVMFVGAQYSYQGPLPEDGMGQVLILLKNLWTGWSFALSLLAILSAHEFGHYFMGRWRKTAVTLPYFIPFPVSILGTMGAFIQMKEVPRNKRVLFDIGIAGPLAGLIVAIPVLVIGLSLSKVEPVENTYYLRESEGQRTVCQTTALVGDSYSCPGDNFMEGNSLLYLGIKSAVKGELLPSPARYEVPEAWYWVRYLVTGHPVPVGGRDVMLHPVAMAGWAGILVTMLNLIPAGQLDGGHVLFAVFGKRVKKVLPFILVLLLGLGFFWNGWWLWAGLIYFLGRVQAEPLDEITQLDPRRKALAVLMLVVFILVLTPVPFVVF